MESSQAPSLYSRKGRSGRIISTTLCCAARLAGNRVQCSASEWKELSPLYCILPRQDAFYVIHCKLDILQQPQIADGRRILFPAESQKYVSGGGKKASLQPLIEYESSLAPTHVGHLGIYADILRVIAVQATWTAWPRSTLNPKCSRNWDASGSARAITK